MKRSQNKSSNYTYMCEQAYELNNYWKPSIGDRVYLKTDLYISLDEGRLTGIKELGQEPTYKEGIYHLSEYTEDEIFDPETFFSFCIFLPYPHQIHEKVLKNLGSEYNVLWAYVEFCTQKKTGQPVHRYSFEELWLLFYYYQVHKKEWDGEDFVTFEEIENARQVYSN